MADSKEGFAAVIERLMSVDDGQDRRRWLRYAGIIPASYTDFKNISNDMFLFMNEVNKYNQGQPNKDKKITHPEGAVQQYMPVLSQLYDIHHESKGTNFSVNTEQYWPKDTTVSFNHQDTPEHIRNDMSDASGYFAPAWNENKVVVRVGAPQPNKTLAHELQHVKYARNIGERVPTTESSLFGLVKTTKDRQRWWLNHEKDREVQKKMKPGNNFSDNAMHNLNEWLANVRAQQAISPEGTPAVYPGLTDAEALHLKEYYK